MSPGDATSDLIAETYERLWPGTEPLSPRKQVLVYVAFVRRFERLFTSDVPHLILATAERVADGEEDLRAFPPLVGACLKQPNRGTGEPPSGLSDNIACELGFYARHRFGEVSGLARPDRLRTAAGDMVHTMLYWLNLLRFAHPERGHGWFEGEVEAFLDYCRDAAGTPAVRLDPRWVSDDVARVATVVYDSRDFARLPALADALEDAGCGHPDILVHCRGPGSHVRGCWVVDLVLGKA